MDRISDVYFRSFMRHARENTLITTGDWFCTFIRHVRENKAQLLIWNTWKIKDSYSFGIPLYGM